MTADNARKTPFQQSISRFADRRIRSAIEAQGRALPCSVVSVQGSIVTVAFEVSAEQTLPQVKVPVAAPQWLRLPIQPGDKGVVFPADVPLGGITGLGAGVPQLNVPAANLTPLVFVPTGATSFEQVDPNAFVAYGPNGVVLRDQNSHCVFTLTPNGLSIIVPSGHNMAIAISGGGALNVTGGTIHITGGDVIADGVDLKTHTHSGVQPGGGNSGPPVP